MPDLFTKDARGLARALIGRQLRVGRRTATIIDTAAYPKSDTEKPLYRALLELGDPGSVRTVQQRGNVLMHILARGGGCVAIRAVEIDGDVVEGPGRVTAALGLTTPKDTGRITEGKDGVLVLTMTTPPSAPGRRTRGANKKNSGKKTRARRPREIGAEIIKRNITAIAGRWLQVRKGKRVEFKSWINGILENCSTEEDLLRAIGGKAP